MLIKIDIAPQIVAWLEEQARASDAANASEVAGRIVSRAPLMAEAELTKATKAKAKAGGDDGGAG